MNAVGFLSFRFGESHRERMVMAKRWYVLHVFSGSEKKVAQSIREQAATHGLEDLVEDVMVPTENVVEVKRGVRVCLLYTSPSPRDRQKSRMPSSA